MTFRPVADTGRLPCDGPERTNPKLIEPADFPGPRGNRIPETPHKQLAYHPGGPARNDERRHNQ